MNRLADLRPGVAVNFLTDLLKAYRARTSADKMTSLLKKVPLRDLSEFFPSGQRTAQPMVKHFSDAGLDPIVTMLNKRQSAAVKDDLIRSIAKMIKAQDSTEEVSRLTLYLWPMLI